MAHVCGGGVEAQQCEIDLIWTSGACAMDHLG